MPKLPTKAKPSKKMRKRDRNRKWCEQYKLRNIRMRNKLRRMSKTLRVQSGNKELRARLKELKFENPLIAQKLDKT